MRLTRDEGCEYPWRGRWIAPSVTRYLSGCHIAIPKKWGAERRVEPKRSNKHEGDGIWEDSGGKDESGKEGMVS